MVKTISLVLVLLLSSSCFAQQTKPSAPAGTRIGTATRLVVMFSNLERRLITGLQNEDQAELARLLATDFEVWTPAPPGSPIPRADWLAKMTGVQAENFSLRQMAVRGLNSHAVASFVLLENGAGKSAAAHFVVDLWARKDNAWKLTDRYISPVNPANYPAERKPTGKD